MIAIREAEGRDAPVVAGLVAALLSELSGKDVVGLGAVTETVLQREDVTGLLAFDAATPVGVLMLNQCAAIYAGGMFGEISELYVTRDWRSHGVASVLLARAQSIARVRGWRRLEVGAPGQPDWARTLAFYRREGFDEVGPRLRWLAQAP